MGNCLGCNKKLGFFEGYSSNSFEFCKECFPKRKEILERREKEEKERKKKEEEDYERVIKEEEIKKRKRIENKDNRKYVLFLDIFCGASIMGAIMWSVPALLMDDFTHMPVKTFNVLFAGLIIYILFWITMQLVLHFSEYKNWSLWAWSGPILLFGIIFAYIFYFVKYRPILLKNSNKKCKS